MKETPLTHVIGTAMRGDDKFKRWPLPEMCAADTRITLLEAALQDCIQVLEEAARVNESTYLADAAKKARAVLKEG